MQFSNDSTISNETQQRGHISVLLCEAVKILSPQDNETYLDCTFGGGGHTRAILDSANCKVVAIDRDPSAVARAEEVKAQYKDRFEFYPLNFSDLDRLQIGGYAGILFDFGVSSFQLDEAERGFSFMREGPLDMRMNTREGATALDYINSVSEYELVQVLRDYGEEPRAKKVARAILSAREAGRISTTSDLAKEIADAIPSHERIHPATRAVQKHSMFSRVVEYLQQSVFIRSKIASRKDFSRRWRDDQKIVSTPPLCKTEQSLPNFSHANQLFQLKKKYRQIHAVEVRNFAQ